MIIKIRTLLYTQHNKIQSVLLLVELNLFRWYRVPIVKHRGSYDGLGDRVRVAIRRRSPVLQVAKPILADLARNADTRAPVGDSRREVVDT